ncbi:hypothetical protein D3C74_403770 [compost metagenome]
MLHFAPRTLTRQKVKLHLLNSVTLSSRRHLNPPSYGYLLMSECYPFKTVILFIHISLLKQETLYRCSMHIIMFHGCLRRCFCLLTLHLKIILYGGTSHGLFDFKLYCRRFHIRCAERAPCTVRLL